MAMAHPVITFPVRAAMDGGAGALIFASMVQWLPPTAALIGMVYYILLILDNRRFIQLANFLTHFKMFHLKVPKLMVSPAFKLHLIDDYNKMWRWFSVRFIAAAAIVQCSLLAFPEELKGYLQHDSMKVIVIGLLVAAVISQAIKQPKLGGPTNGPDKPVQS